MAEKAVLRRSGRFWSQIRMLTPGATVSRLFCRLRGRQLIVLELMPQHELLDFAGRGVRNLVDEYDVVRHPPLRNLILHEGKDIILGGVLAFLENYDKQRPLGPFRMRYADHGGFRHLGVSDREV